MSELKADHRLNTYSHRPRTDVVYQELFETEGSRGHQVVVGETTVSLLDRNCQIQMIP